MSERFSVPLGSSVKSNFFDRCADIWKRDPSLLSHVGTHTFDTIPFRRTVPEFVSANVPLAAMLRIKMVKRFG